jgi:hypothetical protein
MNSEIIILLSTISTGLLGLFALCVRYAFLSKCVKVKLCNCIEWERDVQIENNIQNVDNNNNNNNNIV